MMTGIRLPQEGMLLAQGNRAMVHMGELRNYTKLYLPRNSKQNYILPHIPAHRVSEPMSLCHSTNKLISTVVSISVLYQNKTPKGPAKGRQVGQMLPVTTGQAGGRRDDCCEQFPRVRVHRLVAVMDTFVHITARRCYLGNTQ